MFDLKLTYHIAWRKHILLYIVKAGVESDNVHMLLAFGLQYLSTHLYVYFEHARSIRFRDYLTVDFKYDKVYIVSQFCHQTARPVAAPEKKMKGVHQTRK